MPLETPKENLEKSDQSSDLNVAIKTLESPKKKHLEEVAIFLDVMMLGVLWINVLILVVHLLFEFEALYPVFDSIHPNFIEWYQSGIQQNFIFIELCFFALYFSELLFRWSLAAYFKTYQAWWLYPVVHWYDAIGMLPIPGFILFRFIRIWIIAVRLHRIGKINMNNWLFLRALNKIITAFISEISDRVAMNILERVSSDIEKHSDYSNRLYRQIIKPRQRFISEELVQRLETALQELYQQRETQLENYYQRTIHNILKDYPEAQKIRSIPVIGERLIEELEETMINLLSTVSKELVTGLNDDETRSSLQDTLDEAIQTFLTAHPAQKGFVRDILLDLINMIQSQMAATKKTRYL